MKHTVFVTPSGEEMVIISKADFDAIEDRLDVAAFDEAERANAGGEYLSHEEMKALLEAPTPLAFWRAKRGMTQAALAKAAGTTQPHVADLESGKHGGSLEIMARIAKALKVKVDDLVDED